MATEGLQRLWYGGTIPVKIIGKKLYFLDNLPINFLRLQTKEQFFGPYHS